MDQMAIIRDLEKNTVMISLLTAEGKSMSEFVHADDVVCRVKQWRDAGAEIRFTKPVKY